MSYKRAILFLVSIGFVTGLIANDVTKSLLEAAESGKIEEAEKALKSSAKLTALSRLGYTPMHTAARKGFRELIRLFVRYDGDINISDKHGSRPLHLAAARLDDVPLVSLLVEFGAGLNAAARFGGTPVRIAARVANIRVVEWLLAHGAHVSDIKNMEVFKNEPVLYSILTNNIQEAKDLLMELISQNEFDQDIFNRAFFLMIALGQEELVAFVLENDSAGIDENGWKGALETAAATGNSVLFDKLYDALRTRLLNRILSYESFIRIVENALYWSSTMGHDPIVSFILERAFVVGEAPNLPLARSGEHVRELLASRASMSDDHRFSLRRILEMLEGAARVQASGIRRPTLTFEGTAESLSRVIPPELIALIVGFLFQPIQHKPI